MHDPRGALTAHDGTAPAADVFVGAGFDGTASEVGDGVIDPVPGTVIDAVASETCRLTGGCSC